jgi:hypothetical protein
LTGGDNGSEPRRVGMRAKFNPDESGCEPRGIGMRSHTRGRGFLRFLIFGVESPARWRIIWKESSSMAVQRASCKTKSKGEANA